MLNFLDSSKSSTHKRQSSLNSTQIDKVLCKHVRYFQGVKAIDLSPFTLIKHSIIVINLNKYYMPCSHWVGVCISFSGCPEYFDSYVLPPYMLEIIVFPQLHSISWTFNRHSLQGLTSNVCGHYSCIYAIYRVGDKRWRLSRTCLYILTTPATQKRQCACSALSFEGAPLEAGWSSSSRASRRYK